MKRAPSDDDILDFAQGWLHLGLSPLQLAEDIWRCRHDVALTATTEAVYALVRSGALLRDDLGAISQVVGASV